MKEKIINKIKKSKTLKELNLFEIELIKKYWFLYTTNTFLEEIEKQRIILYSFC